MKLLNSAAVVLGSVVALSAAPSFAISYGGLGSLGEGGHVNGHEISIGNGGAVYQLDSFLHEDGALEAAQLGYDHTADYDIVFDGLLEDSDSDLILSYEITRVASGGSDVTFLHFLDADIDVDTNTFYNEKAYTGGSLAAGQNYEIDEPGFLFGDIYDNLFAGELDGTNAFGPADDVSMALSFDLGYLGQGQSALVEIMISEDGDFLGPFWMTQYDPESEDTTITYSGRASRVGGGPTSAIPEPSAALVFALGTLFTSGAVRKRRC